MTTACVVSKLQRREVGGRLFDVLSEFGEFVGRVRRIGAHPLLPSRLHLTEAEREHGFGRLGVEQVGEGRQSPGGEVHVDVADRGIGMRAAAVGIGFGPRGDQFRRGVDEPHPGRKSVVVGRRIVLFRLGDVVEQFCSRVVEGPLGRRIWGRRT